jgi:D-xylose transport system permease protein
VADIGKKPAEKAGQPTPADMSAEIDLTAAAVVAPPPEVVAQTLGEYLRAYLLRVRSGDAGVLPVVIALLAVGVVFQIVGPKGLFLSPGNLVNLFIQSAVFMVLAMSEGFVLLLGEIDLSVGYVAAIGGIVAANMVQPRPYLPWWLAVIVALAVCAGFGLVQGLIITRLRLPSFVVTLAGYLIGFGIMIVLLGASGGVSISSPILYNQQVLYSIVYGNLAWWLGWLGLLGVVAVFALIVIFRDFGRRRSGLVAPPAGLTVLKIVFIVVAGAAVVAICNVNRGRGNPVIGVPYEVPIVLFVVAVWTVLLEQTQFGRHVYAVGGNAEAARRAGINVDAVRTICFVLCSFTAGIAGIIYCSWQGGMTTNINGGQLVLYAVAAAVIGGTSLFGGRGRAIHGILGGLVIGGIYNGMFLLGLDIQWQLIATGLVLLAAVVVDALSRRGAGVRGATA